MPESSTNTLIEALNILARDIQSQDGVANAAISEAAQRLRKLQTTLGIVIGWVDSDPLSLETRQQAMHRISKICHEAFDHHAH